MIVSPSVDQVAARAVGDQTFLPSLEIGLAGHENKYSFRTADVPMPFEANPRLVFDRMFRGRTPVVPNWKNRATQRGTDVPRSPAPTAERAVVDLIREEANDLRRNLGHGDKQLLDEYLDTVRACVTLNIDPGSPDWEWLTQITAWKPVRRLQA